MVLPTKKEKKIKKNASSIWITNDFPLKFLVFSLISPLKFFQELFPIFDFLSKGNDLMKKLSIIFENEVNRNKLYKNNTFKNKENTRNHSQQWFSYKNTNSNKFYNKSKYLFFKFQFSG